MCAIAGIVNTTENISEFQRQDLEKMMFALRRRGLDAEGNFIDGKVALGSRRLSIVDLKNGNQPIVDNTRSLYAITYNGELFNYKSIQGELKKIGYIFQTDSDTEVVLKAYEEWGPRCLDKFDAEFAFAIYDREKGLIFAARDRTGIKPFYYYQDDKNNFYFASEPKAFIKCKGVRKEIDMETVADFFLGNCTFAAGNPALNRSFFKNIFALEPGHYLVYKNGAITIEQYWDLPISNVAEPIE